MSENSEQTSATNGASELDVLKQRARMMGITFSNNISLETLRERVNAKLAPNEVEADENDEAETNPEIEAEAEVNGLEAAAEVAERSTYRPALDHDHDGRNGGSLPKEKRNAGKDQSEKPLTAAQKKVLVRQQLIKEEMKLVRCRIQNLDPKKANLPGEIFTVANRILGTVRKFVPYGEVTEDGYHIPYIIYQQLEARRFLNIRTTKDRRTGQIKVETAWAKEFAIEILPPLTQEELDKLANAQRAAGSVDGAPA